MVRIAGLLVGKNPLILGKDMHERNDTHQIGNVHIS